jgi:hypothetical protein
MSEDSKLCKLSFRFSCSPLPSFLERRGLSWEFIEGDEIEMSELV